MKQNRYVAAFKENYNLVGLATAAAAAAAMLNPLPLLIGAVAEAAYLMFYADSRWYAARLAKQFDGEVMARRAELKAKVLPTLHPSMRARFERLEAVRAGINDQSYDQEQWYREVLRKLDFFLEKWLMFATKDLEFRRYLESVRDEIRAENGQPPSGGGAYAATPLRSVRQILKDDDDDDDKPGRSRARLSKVPPVSDDSSAQQRKVQSAKTGARMSQASLSEEWVKESVQEIQAGYDVELNDIARQRAGESDPNTCAVLDKRLEVIRRRREFVAKIGRIHLNLDHQLSLLEDTFGLISDEIRARSPEQVLADIDDVVSQTNTMTQLLEEVAPFEQLLAS